MTMMTNNFKIESAQPVCDTFCEPVPKLPRKLQLEHHQCIRLLKAVYGLVDASRIWDHFVATDFRHMNGEESVMEPCFWTFRGAIGVIHALCLVYVDDFMLACSDHPFGEHVIEIIYNLYEWGKWESRVFKQCGAQITQACNKHKPARKAIAWARTPLKIHAHHTPVVVTYTDAGWTTRPDDTSQGGQLVFIANSELLQGRKSNMSLISWRRID